MNVRLAHPGDASALSAFARQATGLDIPAAVWDWKYFSNPFGPSGLALALEGEAIVGMAGAFALPMQVPGGPCTASQVADNDILEPHRSTGTLFRLIETLNRAAGADSGRGFDFGLAIEQTRDFSTMMLGFETVAAIRKYVRILDPGRYLAARWHVPLGAGLGLPFRWRAHRAAVRLLRHQPVFALDRFDARFDALWARMRKAPIMVRKDAAYLNWRYARCPGVTYRTLGIGTATALSGAVIFHVAAKAGVRYGILDEVLCAEDAPGILDPLLAAATRELLGRQVSACMAWASQGDPLRERLLQAGYRERSTPHSLIARRGRVEAPDGFLAAEQNWMWSIGDSDSWIFPR
ncbi:MAG: hypothetical protein K8T26_03770 [Lentisphaerae bacterium]|nr:hypothetical protein [Lentisphaerota bacterium]